MRTVLAVSDLQVPYHHPRAVTALTKFVEGWAPDEVICVGDEIDMPQISQWTRGTRGEYAGQLHKQRDEAVRLLEALRVNHVMRSNHSDRLAKYLHQHAPGLADEPALQLPTYMRYADLGITYHRTMYEFAPEWLLAHGDEGGLSNEPGKTARRLAERTGKSIVCGHTHRAGIQPVTYAHTGKVTRQLYGMEVGCLMDPKKAGYLKGGPFNWQLAFGIFHVDGKHVSPHIVYMRPDGSFIWEGREWK